MEAEQLHLANQLAHMGIRRIIGIVRTEGAIDEQQILPELLRRVIAA